MNLVPISGPGIGWC